MTSSNSREQRSAGDPVLANVERELRRGNYLRGDDRPLSRVLADDAALVAGLDLDLEEITSRMKRLYDQGRRGFGDPVIVDDTFEVSVREDRGMLPCPWQDHYPAPKAIVSATNLKNGKTVRFSVLGWHMIRVHGFFQGYGSPFRMEPRDLKEFFG